MAVDINGLPQTILVTQANVSDRSGALTMFSLANQTLDLVQRVMVDDGYTGEDFASQVKLILDAKTTVAKRSELHTFKLATATMDYRAFMELVRQMSTTLEEL